MKHKTRNIVRYLKNMYIAAFGGQKKTPLVNSVSLRILAAILDIHI